MGLSDDDPILFTLRGLEARMKRFLSIRKNQEFRVVYENGRSKGNSYLVMYVRRREQEENRIGISASKKIGNSIVRHRMTRLLREIFRLHTENLKKGYDLVVVIRASAVGRSYREIESAYLHLLQLHGIFVGTVDPGR
jgi:hypothetical protein